jgi:predicted enzyme related to lactoylglutathione lyase
MSETQTFIWHELITTDQERSGAFYSKLFAWTRKQVDAGPLGTYVIFQIEGKDVAGMMNPTIEYTKKLGSRWYGYVGVESIDQSIASALALGAQLVAGPDDIQGIGKVCMLADPNGAHIRLMQPAAASQGT